MLEKYWEYLNTRGAIHAKINGIYLNTYTMVRKIKDLGIYPNTFIDVGANRGMLAKTVNYIYPNCKIYSFEPIKNCYVELQTLENSITNLKSFNCALSDYTGTADFHESKYDYSSSLLKMAKKHIDAFPYTEESSAYKVDVHPLEYFSNKMELKSPIILKIDVQGAELKVMQGTGEIANFLDYIICEMSLTELYEGQPLIGDVVKYMSEKGFNLIDMLGLNRNTQNKELLQVDGLFKRI